MWQRTLPRGLPMCQAVRGSHPTKTDEPLAGRYLCALCGAAAGPLPNGVKARVAKAERDSGSSLQTRVGHAGRARAS